MCIILISFLHVSHNHCQEVINRFPEGDSLMSKLHHLAKHFSSSGVNRKNYDSILSLNPFLPNNQLEQDLN